jgi:hypothetical protein
LLADSCFHHAWIFGLSGWITQETKRRLMLLAFSFYILSRRSWDITMGSLSVAFSSLYHAP